MINLDYECMKYAQEISKINDQNLENNLRKALGVLQEDGIYAMFLWIESRNNGKNIREILSKLLNESEIRKHILTDLTTFPKEFNRFCEKLREIAQDVDKLLFIKKLLERTLIYALYHTKIGE